MEPQRIYPLQDSPIYIVTGATRGIGRAIARKLAERRFRVIAVGRSEELLDSLRESCGALLTAVRADLTTEEGVQAVAESIASASVTEPAVVDGIVHSAGSLVPLTNCSVRKTRLTLTSRLIARTYRNSCGDQTSNNNNMNVEPLNEH